MDANVRPRSLCDANLHPPRTKNPAANNSHAGDEQKASGPFIDKEEMQKSRVSWPNSSTAKTESPVVNYPAPLIASDRAPSMAGLLNTTVPQRLVTRNNRRHHTPTRHSLRHSRMISLIQQGKVPRKYLPRIIRRYKLGTCLAIIQIILGLLLIAIALFFLLWNPTLQTPYIPHWSGIPLILSGLFAIFLFCCCRKPYPGMDMQPWTLIAKPQYLVISVILAVIAAIVCVSASIFMSVHDSQLFHMSCTPNSSLTDSVEFENTTCTCRSDDKDHVTYEGLTCSDVKSQLPTFMIISSVANSLAALVTLGHIVLIWTDRRSFHYAGVTNHETKTDLV